MLKNFYFPLISFTLIVATIYISFERQLPKYQPDIENSISAFSTDRALLHLAEISKNPHYVGAAEHLNVRNYLVEELKKINALASNEISIGQELNITK